MKKLIILFMILSFSITIKAEEKTIALYEFSLQNIDFSDYLLFKKLLQSYLSGNLKNFQIMPSEVLQEIIKNLNLTNDCFEETCLKDYKKQIGVDYLVSGAISTINNQTKIKILIVNNSTKQEYIDYTLSLKQINNSKIPEIGDKIINILNNNSKPSSNSVPPVINTSPNTIVNQENNLPQQKEITQPETQPNVSNNVEKNSTANDKVKTEKSNKTHSINFSIYGIGLFQFYGPSYGLGGSIRYSLTPKFIVEADINGGSSITFFYYSKNWHMGSGVNLLYSLTNRIKIGANISYYYMQNNYYDVNRENYTVNKFYFYTAGIGEITFNRFFTQTQIHAGIKKPDNKLTTAISTKIGLLF